MFFNIERDLDIEQSRFWSLKVLAGEVEKSCAPHKMKIMFGFQIVYEFFAVQLHNKGLQQGEKKESFRLYFLWDLWNSQGQP